MHFRGRCGNDCGDQVDQSERRLSTDDYGQMCHFVPSYIFHETLIGIT